MENTDSKTVNIVFQGQFAPKKPIPYCSKYNFSQMFFNLSNQISSKIKDKIEA